jgi:hypothetical protein
MQQTNNKKIITLQKIYSNLADLLHFIKPSLICAVSIRMIELTLSGGLSPCSPLAFAYYGQMITGSGNLAEGCRLGKYSCIMTVVTFAEMCCFMCSLFNHVPLFSRQS